MDDLKKLISWKLVFLLFYYWKKLISSRLSFIRYFGVASRLLYEVRAAPSLAFLTTSEKLFLSYFFNHMPIFLLTQCAVNWCRVHLIGHWFPWSGFNCTS